MGIANATLDPWMATERARSPLGRQRGDEEHRRGMIGAENHRAPSVTGERIVLSVALTVLGVAVIGFAVTGLVLPYELRSSLFSESGPFETASEWLWAVLALVCLLQADWTWQRRWLFAMAASLLAMREADWHKAFTTDSIFKTNYYLESAAPLWEKVIGGLVAVGALACLVALLVMGWKSLVKQRRAFQPWGVLVIVGAALLPAVKVLDRVYNVLNEDFGVRLSDRMGAVIGALEEGTESLLPLVFLTAVWLYRMHGRRANRAHA
jgi:hypothetical protein